MPELNLKNVRFRRKEVIELLRMLPTLKDMGRTGRELAMELESRLDACMLSGLMAKEFYTWEDDIEHIAFVHGTTITATKRIIPQVLRYISGWERKRRTFTQFVQHKAGK